MEEIKTLISHNLKYFREQRNLTKVELAKEMSPYLSKPLDSSYLTTWESGKCNPSMETMIALCKALNVSMDDLVHGRSGYNQTNYSNTRIPVLGTIRAGIPNTAVEDILDYEDITEDMAKRGKHFGLKIRGNSMSPNLLENDVVIFRECEDAETGDVCAILVNGDEATVKKIKKTEQGLYLIPYNTTDFEPTFFTNDEVKSKPVRIIGKAIEIRRSL